MIGIALVTKLHTRLLWSTAEDDLLKQVEALRPGWKWDEVVHECGSGENRVLAAVLVAASATPTPTTQYLYLTDLL